MTEEKVEAAVETEIAESSAPVEEAKKGNRYGRLTKAEMDDKKMLILAILRQGPLRKIRLEEKLGTNAAVAVADLLHEGKLEKTTYKHEIRFKLTELGVATVRGDTTLDSRIAQPRSYGYMLERMDGTKKLPFMPEPSRPGALDFTKIPSLVQGQRQDYSPSKITLQGGRLDAPDYSIGVQDAFD